MYLGELASDSYLLFKALNTFSISCKDLFRTRNMVFRMAGILVVKLLHSCPILHWSYCQLINMKTMTESICTFFFHILSKFCHKSIHWQRKSHCYRLQCQVVTAILLPLLCIDSWISCKIFPSKRKCFQLVCLLKKKKNNFPSNWGTNS